MHDWNRQNSNLFVCPACNSKLIVGGKIKCSTCRTIFKIEDGIPLFFSPNNWQDSKDVTDIVVSFYEKTPFPNYDSIDSIFSLREKANKSIFSRLLDEQIPHQARILEAGCGTGQLSNLLGSMWNRQIFATDICLNSLKLGQHFKKKAKIRNTYFFQMNLFKPIFRPEVFDFVICNGVLHHTGNPQLGFKTIANLVKPGGYIIIGLYNKIGRIPTDIRRLLFKVSGEKFKFLDTYLKDKKLSELKKNTWFKDQYQNPHESKHTIEEVLGWFAKNGFEFINGVPKLTLSDFFEENEKLFYSNHKGSIIDHLLVQLGMLLSGGKEGGFFVMIGRKYYT